jgi:DNA primase
VQLPNSEQRIFFERAVTQYQTDLGADTSAQAYLRGRGIGPEIAGTFRLGVVRTPLPGHEGMRGRLCIPYLTPSGVVAFTFRCLQDHSCKEVVLWVNDEGKEVHCRKYLAPEGMDRTLYNVLDLKKATNVLYLCEGEIDTLTLSSCGFPAVGIPGVKNWKPHYTKALADYVEVGHIFCVADGDEAGRKMARFLAKEVGAHTVRPPQGEDINSIYVRGGTRAVQQWLAGAV